MASNGAAVPAGEKALFQWLKGQITAAEAGEPQDLSTRMLHADASLAADPAVAPPISVTVRGGGRAGRGALRGRPRSRARWRRGGG